MKDKIKKKNEIVGGERERRRERKNKKGRRRDKGEKLR